MRFDVGVCEPVSTHRQFLALAFSGRSRLAGFEPLTAWYMPLEMLLAGKTLPAVGTKDHVGDAENNITDSRGEKHFEFDRATGPAQRSRSCWMLAAY